MEFLLKLAEWFINRYHLNMRKKRVQYLLSTHSEIQLITSIHKVRMEIQSLAASIICSPANLALLRELRRLSEYEADIQSILSDDCKIKTLQR